MLYNNRFLVYGVVIVSVLSQAKCFLAHEMVKDEHVPVKSGDIVGLHREAVRFDNLFKGAALIGVGR